MTDLPTLADMLPERMPRGWKQRPSPTQTHLESRWWTFGPLLIGCSLDTWKYETNGVWLHTSVSAGGKRLPTWAELVAVKEAVHEDRPCIQIIPPRSQWVSIAEVLHLWERIDRPTLPEDVWRRDGHL